MKKQRKKGFSFCDHCSTKNCTKCPLKGGDK